MPYACPEKRRLCIKQSVARQRMRLREKLGEEEYRKRLRANGAAAYRRHSMRQRQQLGDDEYRNRMRLRQKAYRARKKEEKAIELEYAMSISRRTRSRSRGRHLAAANAAEQSAAGCSRPNCHGRCRMCVLRQGSNVEPYRVQQKLCDPLPPGLYNRLLVEVKSLVTLVLLEEPEKYITITSGCGSVAAPGRGRRPLKLEFSRSVRVGEEGKCSQPCRCVGCATSGTYAEDTDIAAVCLGCKNCVSKQFTCVDCSQTFEPRYSYGFGSGRSSAGGDVFNTRILNSPPVFEEAFTYLENENHLKPGTLTTFTMLIYLGAGFCVRCWCDEEVCPWFGARIGCGSSLPMHRDQIPEKKRGLNSTEIGSPCYSLHFGNERTIAVRFSESGTGRMNDSVEFEPKADVIVAGGRDHSVSVLPSSDEHFNIFDDNGTRVCGTVLHGVCQPLSDYCISVGLVARVTEATAQVSSQTDCVQWPKHMWERYICESTKIKYCAAGFTRPMGRIGARISKKQYYRRMTETWNEDAKKWAAAQREHVEETLSSSAWMNSADHSLCNICLN